MKKNIGNIDKAVRIMAAVIIGVLYLTNIISGLWTLILLAIAGIFIATSFMSFCPLYFLFGISTHKKSQNT